MNDAAIDNARTDDECLVAKLYRMDKVRAASDGSDHSNAITYDRHEEAMCHWTKRRKATMV